MNALEKSLIDAVLARFPLHLRHRPLVLAFSGGLDSSVLLHLLFGLHQRGSIGPLRAVHIHHGLHPHADAWVEQARQTCAKLDLPLSVEQVKVRAHGEGVEAAARKVRYAALARHLGAGEVLITAHHRDDQAETFFLQLMRGAGVRGLASMPAVLPFAQGWHLRPLLDVARKTLHAYALAHDLQWINDPSNADPRHARNFLRHHVFPALHAHWPEAEATLARAARRMAITEELLSELGRLDLAAARSDQVNRLDAMALARLPEQRLFNAVRTWLIELGLPLPPQARLAEIRRMLEARDDALPCLRWPGGELRRWRGGFYALRERGKIHAGSFILEWKADAALECPELGLRLVPKQTLGTGLRWASVAPHGLTIRLRQGGERIHVAGQAHRQSLKKLLHSAAIPPWERERLPLFFIGDRLVQVGEHWIEASYCASQGEPGLCIVLERLV